MTPLEKGQTLTEEEYLEAFEQYGDEFDAMMGAEAIQKSWYKWIYQKKQIN